MIMGKDMDRLSEDNYKQRNESYIQKLRDERDEKLKKRYEELKGTKLEEKKEDKWFRILIFFIYILKNKKYEMYQK